VFRKQLGELNLVLFATPLFEQAEGVVPKGVDLDGFSAAGRYDPIADFCVHPVELITFLAFVKEAVFRIHTNAEFSAPQMMFDNVAQYREQCGKSLAIVSSLQVTMQGLEKPEGGVRGVVEAFVPAFGKHIWE
jgi:hypothetical protein